MATNGSDNILVAERVSDGAVVGREGRELGAQLGAHISLRLSGRVIHWMLAIALLGLSVRLLVGA